MKFLAFQLLGPLTPVPTAGFSFKCKYVKLADTIKGFTEICDGKHDDIPEQAFYMQGTIEEVLEKAEQMKKDN